MKYNIYSATFTQASGPAIYKNGSADFFSVRNQIGSFLPGEQIVVSNSILTATASANGSNTIIISNTSIADLTTVNNFIYIGTNNRSVIQVAKIVSACTSTNTVVLSSAVGFTDAVALIGRVKADSNLFGYVSTRTRGSADHGMMILSSVTSNATSNFTSCNNQYFIGLSSGASAYASNPLDLPYDSITSQFAYIAPKLTSENWNFRGSSSAMVLDSSYTNITANKPYEFIDQPRIIMSKSNEQQFNGGVSSLLVQTNITTTDLSISPYVDRIRTNTTLTHNLIGNISLLNGYSVSIANGTGVFAVGDTVWQSNSTANVTAIVQASNSSLLQVINIISSNASVLGSFTANSTSIITDANSSFVANVSSISVYSEDLGNTPTKGTTRYISKNVNLATGQDADDLLCYVDAYRPPGTNVLVYGKILAGADGDAFNNKSWSIMPETSSPGLISSLINQNNIVELSYDLPSSVPLYPNGSIGNTTTQTLVMPLLGSTAGIYPGNFVYITDPNLTPVGFNVRQIISVPNSTVIIISSNLSFTSANAAVGYIPGLQIQSGAFKYDQNYNIVRYCTLNDSVYDTFINFAIKIVLVSNTSQIVPKISDFRSLALQI
jgi:hypothetical protein